MDSSCPVNYYYYVPLCPSFLSLCVSRSQLPYTPVETGALCFLLAVSFSHHFHFTSASFLLLLEHFIKKSFRQTGKLKELYFKQPCIYHLDAKWTFYYACFVILSFHLHPFYFFCTFQNKLLISAHFLVNILACLAWTNITNDICSFFFLLM